MEFEASGAEAVGGAGHVESPDSIGCFRDGLQGFAGVGFEASHPFLQGEGVVLAQILEVANLKADGLRDANGGVDGNELSIGKYILVNERRAAAAKSGGDGDAVIEKRSARAQKIPGMLEIFGETGLADMFHHSDAGDLVERLRGVEIAIVADLHAAAIGQACLANAIARQGGLLLAQGDTKGIDAIVGGSVENQSSPAATYVEKTISGTEAQFSTDVVELGDLRGVEAGGGRREVSTGVDHARVKPKRVKVIREIVVVGDGTAVAIARVQRAPETGVALRVSRGRRCRKLREQLAELELIRERIVAGEKEVGDGENRLEIALEINIAIYKCFGEG